MRRGEAGGAGGARTAGRGHPAGQLAEAEAANAQAEAAHAEAEAANKRQRIQLDAILASTSWRMTAPIRAGSRCLSALRLLGRRR
jgi:hypothetical protein